MKKGTLLDEVLNFDVIDNMEKLANKRVDDFSDDEICGMFGAFMLINKRKEDQLVDSHDTYFSMSWDYFIGLIKENGFKEGLEYEFEDPSYDDKHTEKAILYYREDGLVIWATSYGNKTSVNGGTLYGELQVDKKTFNRSVLMNCSNGYFDDNKVSFTIDVREALFHILNRIESAASFIPVWEERNKFLWFLDFTEDDIPDYDYAAISKDKIQRSTDGLKRIMKNQI